MKSNSVSTYKTSLINNRRYLGNKYKLLPLIKRVVQEQKLEFSSLADIFAAHSNVVVGFLLFHDFFPPPDKRILGSITE